MARACVFRNARVEHKALSHRVAGAWLYGCGADEKFVFAICAALRRACWSVAFSSRARSALSDRTQPRPLLVCDLRSPRASRLGAIRISGPVPSQASSEDGAAPHSPFLAGSALPEVALS
jgi:hypothetical protein